MELRGGLEVGRVDEKRLEVNVCDDAGCFFECERFPALRHAARSRCNAGYGVGDVGARLPIADVRENGNCLGRRRGSGYGMCDDACESLSGDDANENESLSGRRRP